MQYFIGSFVTIATLLFCSRIFSKQLAKPKLKIGYSQSHAYSLLGPIFGLLETQKKPLDTQASKYFGKVNQKILIYNKEAYWIKDNSVFVCNIIDGELDENSTKKVDTMGMDDVQLKKMMFIVEKLTEGMSNDNRNPGKS